MAGPDVDLIFVSDLHLGRTGQSRSPAYVEGFAGLLEYLEHRASVDRRPCRLVLLGDTFHFRRASAASARNGRVVTDTSSDGAVLQLNDIARAEPLFFGALGRFSASGCAIDVIPGNHDIELVRPKVQQRLCELVEEISPRTGAGNGISFHPWIYHLPGVVYAEHGHQHHDINSFTTVLRPYAVGDDDLLDLPLAAYLPDSGLHRCSARLREIARSTDSLVRQAIDLSRRDRRHRRLRYRDDVLRRYAAEVALDHDTLVAIDRLSETSVASVASRLLRQALFRRTGGERPTQRGGYLHGAALAIDGILASAGATVPCYVFGHAHIAEEFPLVRDASSPKYLNTGTWSPHLPRGLAPEDGAELLTFIQIRASPGTKPDADVLIWDRRSQCSRRR